MSAHDSGARRRTTLQTAALVVGVGFLLVGVLGFIPGVTSDYDQLAAAGHESDAMLLGIFEVSVLHNIVHLLFGVLGIAASRRFSSSRAYLIGGGIVYLVLWVYGLVVDEDSAANFVPLNSADNWLHLLLGLGMVLLGVALSRGRHAVTTDDTYSSSRRTGASGGTMR